MAFAKLPWWIQMSTMVMAPRMFFTMIPIHSTSPSIRMVAPSIRARAFLRRQVALPHGAPILIYPCFRAPVTRDCIAYTMA